MSKKRWISALVIAMVILLAVLGFWAIRQARLARLADPLAGYSQASAVKGALNRSVEASGNIIPGKRDLLYTQYSVRVMEIATKAGQAVKKGQFVARYESSGLTADIVTAGEQLDAARSTASRDMSGQLDVSMLSSLGLAQSGTKSKAELQSSYDRLVDAKGRLTYKAPFDGLVAQVKGLAGQELAGTTSASPLVELVGSEGWYAEVMVSEYDINAVKLGMDAEIEVLAAGKSINGKVEGITLVPQRSSGASSYEVAIAVEGKHEDLKPGMSADARIIISERQGVLIIPYGYAYEEGGSSYVIVAGPDGKPQARKVSLGEEGDAGIEVLDGLAEGEPVYLKTNEVEQAPGGIFTFRARMTGGR